MSLFIFYKSESEHDRDVRDYLREFEQRTSHALETVDPDSAHGIELCEVYDIVEYPTIIATSEDGQLRASWRGLPLPTIDEVSYYV